MAEGQARVLAALDAAREGACVGCLATAAGLKVPEVREAVTWLLQTGEAVEGPFGVCPVCEKPRVVIRRAGNLETGSPAPP
jgi:hypothetical protein